MLAHSIVVFFPIVHSDHSRPCPGATAICQQIPPKVVVTLTFDRGDGTVRVVAGRQRYGSRDQRQKRQYETGQSLHLRTHVLNKMRSPRFTNILKTWRPTQGFGFRFFPPKVSHDKQLCIQVDWSTVQVFLHIPSRSTSGILVQWKQSLESRFLVNNPNGVSRRSACIGREEESAREELQNQRH